MPDDAPIDLFGGADDDSSENITPKPTEKKQVPPPADETYIFTEQERPIPAQPKDGTINSTQEISDSTQELLKAGIVTNKPKETDTSIEDRSGTKINGVLAEEKIGAGGMGDVYLGRRTNKEGLDQVVTNLSHPESDRFLHIYYAQKLIYHAERGRISPEHLLTLGLEGFKVDVPGEDLEREIAETGKAQLIYRAAASHVIAAKEILHKPEYSDLEELLALKLTQAKPGLVERAMREGNIQSRAINPVSVMLMYSGKFEDRYCLASEFIPSDFDLDPDKLAVSGYELTEESIAMLFYLGARYVDFLINELGVTHRDIKPNNFKLKPQKYFTADSIIVRKKTKDGYVLIPYELKGLDVGLGKDLDQTESQRISQSTMILGTPVYMPAEGFDLDAVATECRDVFSLGATIYHIMTFKNPFGGEQPTRDSIAYDLVHNISINPNGTPVFPSKSWNLRHTKKLNPHLGSLVLRTLMRGRALHTKLSHKEDSGNYRKPRVIVSVVKRELERLTSNIPSPDYLPKPEGIEACVDSGSSVQCYHSQAQLTHREDQLKMMYHGVPLLLSDEAKGEIERLTTEISESNRRLEKASEETKDLSDLARSLKIFTLHGLIARAYSHIADLIPPSTEKEVDTLESRKTKAYYLGKREFHDDAAVELMQGYLTDDIWRFLSRFMGKSAMDGFSDALISHKSIAEKPAETEEAKKAQTVRLMEEIWGTESYTDPSKEIKGSFIARAGNYSRSLLNKEDVASQSRFIQYKGELAFQALVDTHAISRGLDSIGAKREDDGVDIFVRFKGTEILGTIHKSNSKEQYVSLRGEEAYARLVEPFRSEQDPHAALVASLKDPDRAEAFKISEGRAYIATVLVSGSREQREFIEYEGRNIYNTLLLKNGINPASKDSHSRLVDSIDKNKKSKAAFVIEEGSLVYKILMDKLDQYSSSLGLSERRERKEEYMFETWMDRMRERSVERSSSTSIDLKAASQQGGNEKILTDISDILIAISEGETEKGTGKHIPGMFKLIKDTGANPSLEAIQTLDSEFKTQGYAPKFEDASYYFEQAKNRIEGGERVTKKYIQIKGIRGGPRERENIPITPQTASALKSIEEKLPIVGPAIELPELLYCIHSYEHKSEIQGELKRLIDENSSNPYSNRKAGCFARMQGPKDQLVSFAKTVTDSMVSSFDESDQILLRHYREALEEYSISHLGSDRRQFEIFYEKHKEAAKRNLVDSQLPERCSEDISKLFQEADMYSAVPERMDFLRELLTKSDMVENIGDMRQTVGQIYIKLQMFTIAGKYLQSQSG